MTVSGTERSTLLTYPHKRECGERLCNNNLPLAVAAIFVWFDLFLVLFFFWLLSFGFRMFCCCCVKQSSNLFVKWRTTNPCAIANARALSVDISLFIHLNVCLFSIETSCIGVLNLVIHSYASPSSCIAAFVRVCVCVAVFLSLFFYFLIKQTVHTRTQFLMHIHA